MSYFERIKGLGFMPAWLSEDADKYGAVGFRQCQNIAADAGFEADQEIARLREENGKLRESLKELTTAARMASVRVDFWLTTFPTGVELSESQRQDVAVSIRLKKAIGAAQDTVG